MSAHNAQFIPTTRGGKGLLAHYTGGHTETHRAVERPVLGHTVTVRERAPAQVRLPGQDSVLATPVPFTRLDTGRCVITE